MNFDKVYFRLRKECMSNNLLFLYREYDWKMINIYHIIIHKLALETFEKIWTTGFDSSNLTYIAISPLQRDEHIHMLVEKRARKEFENGTRIRSERIISKLKFNDVLNKYFYCRKEHDFFCNITFNCPTLQSICIKSILKNLNYLHSMEKLKLPKKIIKEIFLQSKQDLLLPESNSKWDTLNSTIFEFFAEQDIAFHKQFVAYFQTTWDIYGEFSDFLIVFYDFRIANNEIVKMCLKCMKFENGNNDFERKYGFFKSIFILKNTEFVQNPMNWCHTCKQVPLFQILTHAQFDDLYTFDIFENYNRHSTFITIEEPLIKTDYFEKGVKVKSDYVTSKKIFGGCNHPYLN